MRTEELTRTAVVTASGGAASPTVTIEAGFDDLTLMKTAKSAFTGFPRDEFTTLAETNDRLLASRVSATWRYGSGSVDFDATFDGVCATLLDVFAEHHSASVQATIWTIGQAILAARPEIDEIRLTMPNLHHWLVDLAPFGQINDREIYVPTSEPYGLIEATIRRSAARCRSAARRETPWLSRRYAEPEPEFGGRGRARARARARTRTGTRTRA